MIQIIKWKNVLGIISWNSHCSCIKNVFGIDFAIISGWSVEHVQIMPKLNYLRGPSAPFSKLPLWNPDASKQWIESEGLEKRREHLRNYWKVPTVNAVSSSAYRFPMILDMSIVRRTVRGSSRRPRCQRDLLIYEVGVLLTTQKHSKN